MGVINCPHCGIPKKVGLPRDATIESVSLTPVNVTIEGKKTKTRKVECTCGAEILFTFSTHIPDDSLFDVLSSPGRKD